jgi:hypothetical protein
MTSVESSGPTELRYRDYVQQIVTRLKSLPEDPWGCLSRAVQRGDVPESPDPVVEQTCREILSSCPEPELRLLWLGTEAIWTPGEEGAGARAHWEEGVLKELYERVKYAAGEATLEHDGRPDGSGQEAATPEFSFDADDLVFLSKVARQLTLLAARRQLNLAQSKAIRRMVAALNGLPDAPPAASDCIEVTHRMGDEAFRETYRYTIAVDGQRIAISSNGSQRDPISGTRAFDLESLEWRANGQSVQHGSRDSWLERLIYALGRDHTVSVFSEPRARTAGEPPADGCL